VTGQTASGTQQMARAAEDLNQLTENLQTLISKFKLSNGEEMHAIEQHHIDLKRKQPSAEKSAVAVRQNGHLVSHES